jgi:hypothetical protein
MEMSVSFQEIIYIFKSVPTKMTYKIEKQTGAAFTLKK